MMLLINWVGLSISRAGQHKAGWEASPSAQDAITWLNELAQILFPTCQLPKFTSYNGIFRKNQIELENILLSYLNPKTTDMEEKVALF